MTVSPRDLLPMFTVTNAVDGAMVRYQDVWQRKNLLLVMAPENDRMTSIGAERMS